jgi:HSP20 family protein
MMLTQFKRRPTTSVVSFADLFDDLFTEGKTQRAFVPAVNIAESALAYRLEVAVPGYAKEDFKLKVEKDQLIISAEKKEETKNESEKVTRKEFHYHSFKRSFHLPETVEGEKIEAKYENGILHVVIPKKEAAKDTVAIEVAVQ